MSLTKYALAFFWSACFSLPVLVQSAMAQSSPAGAPSGSILDKFMTAPGSNTDAWTQEQIRTMGRLRDAAMSDPYAYEELTHLTNGIGPRLTGSPQAAAAVEWVAAEMRSLGATVTLEKTSVPHWIRGEETAALTSWPGMVAGTTQKIVLTALGNSVATPSAGLTAQVVVVNSFTDLKSLSPEAVKGKIVLFNCPLIRNSPLRDRA